VVDEAEGRRMLKIGEVSKRSGVGVEALRFYEKGGLLDSPSRTFGGYRVYGEDHNTNMDTLVALGTGAAWVYSAVAVAAPGLFPAGTAGMYFEVAVIVIMVGVGKAAEHGVLIRNGEALETASRLEVVVLDKTGTITKGRPELTDVLPLEGFAEEELLRLAGTADRRSEHPPASAIVEGARAHGIELGEAEKFDAVPGHGVEAVVGGRRVAVGNRKLMERESVSLAELEEMALRLADEGKTPMFVAVDGRAAGIIGVADTLKEDSVAAVRALERMGVEVVIITGDNERTARAIARQVGIGRVPADVGFAIGTGTDVAIEAADVMLVGGSLRGVVTAIEVSRATLRNIKQNLFGTFVGLGIIGWIVWYFWLWEGESVAARVHAVRRGGRVPRFRQARTPARGQDSRSRGHAAAAGRVRVHLRHEHVQGQTHRAVRRGNDPSIRAAGLDVVDFSMRQRIRRWVDFNFSIDNLLDKHYFETQNFLESRISPIASIVAQIHGTPGYSRGVTAGLTFHLFNKGQ
jgi:hypothetical protein